MRIPDILERKRLTGTPKVHLSVAPHTTLLSSPVYNLPRFTEGFYAVDKS